MPRFFTGFEHHTPRRPSRTGPRPFDSDDLDLSCGSDPSSGDEHAHHAPRKHDHHRRYEQPHKDFTSSTENNLFQDTDPLYNNRTRRPSREQQSQQQQQPSPSQQSQSQKPLLPPLQPHYRYA
ncbi:hypothetical protein AOQ84DRAFT_222598, partial [Glonium stellatum]